MIIIKLSEIFIGFDTSPFFNLFKLLLIFWDNEVSFIHPILPPTLDVSDLLYKVAVFSNPIDLKLLIISL